MFYRKDEVLGFFVPSFFYISLDTSANSLPYLNDEERATYTHEYIHFMQDITTGFGISRLIFSLHQLCDLFSNINDCTSFDDCLDSYYNLLENNSEKESTLNDFRNEYCDDKINDVSRRELINFKLDHKNYIAILEFKKLNNSRSSYTYRFSSCDIEEGMASFIQRKIFHTSADSIPRFPYKIMEEVVDYIAPSRLTDVELIQLCDLALQSTSPGYAFITLLLDVKDNVSVDSLWEKEMEVIDRRNGQQKCTYKPYETCKNIVESDVFREALRCSYEGECRKDIYNYVLELCIKGATYRQEKRSSVFSDLLSIDKTTIASKINSLHATLGAPNVFRKKDNHYFGASAERQIGAGYLPILDTLVKRALLDTHKLVCPYCSDCRSEEHKYNKVYNDNCKENFLLNIVEDKGLCMATALAKSMGIKSTF